MKNLELRSSLIKTGVIATLCVIFIYAFAVEDSGGVTGTIGSLFSLILFAIGLVISIAVSVAVMFGVYFGILYLYNPNICKTIYAEFKSKLGECSLPCGHSCSTPKAASAPSISDDDLNPLRDTQEKLGKQITDLQSSIGSLEKMLGTVSASVSATTDNLTNLDEKTAEVKEELENKATTDSVSEASKKLESSVTAVQGSIKPLSDKIAELEAAISSTNDDSEDNALEETVNNAISAFKDEIQTMNTAIANLSKQATPKGITEKQTEASEEHRILSYFTKKNDKKKFSSLVKEAIDKKMTYAQVGELLDDSLSASASEVIADHPSLTKDYIRICRQTD